MADYLDDYDEDEFNDIPEDGSPQESILAESDQQRLILSNFGLEVLEEEYCDNTSITLVIELLSVFHDIEDNIRKEYLETYNETLDLVENPLASLLGLVSPEIANKIEHKIIINDNEAWSIYIDIITKGLK